MGGEKLSKSAQQSFRIERDSMGEVRVSGQAYYGAQTQRARENFSISTALFPCFTGFPPRFIHTLALIKYAAAETNAELKLLDPTIARHIRQAAREVMKGKLDAEFVVDVFQTGSGTSTHMNVNEVIANRALERWGKRRGRRDIHPNDHVNMGQSSNDVIPTAIHVSGLAGIREELLPALRTLKAQLARKAREFHGVVKVGRTHLNDATPIRLGQEFSGYARQIELGIDRIRTAGRGLEELALGGTAVGTGINTHPEFARRTIEKIRRMTGLPLREARNHFEAQGAKDAVVYVSGALKSIALSVAKISSDIAWLASGPRSGIGEIRLPEIQPGSSIMPGKVNPVVCESALQVSAHVVGCDATITACAQYGHFELNTMMPLMAVRLLEAVYFTAAAVRALSEKCIAGIRANEARCREGVEQSLGMATSLTPNIGYDAAAEIAIAAYTTGRTVREVARERLGAGSSGKLSEKALDAILDPRSMTRPSAMRPASKVKRRKSE